VFLCGNVYISLQKSIYLGLLYLALAKNSEMTNETKILQLVGIRS
jgi:hypothetical protein